MILLRKTFNKVLYIFYLFHDVKLKLYIRLSNIDPENVENI